MLRTPECDRASPAAQIDRTQQLFGKQKFSGYRPDNYRIKLNATKIYQAQ